MAELRILNLQLGTCEKLLGQDSKNYILRLGKFKEYVDSMTLQVDALLGLAEKLQELHTKALETKRSAAADETLEVLDHVLARAFACSQQDSGQNQGLSGTLFATQPVQDFTRVQQELMNWLRPGWKFRVKSKEDLLKDVDSSLVAIRWLSFRVAIRRNPKPLHELAAAVAACRKRKVRDGEEKRCKKEERIEQEKFHYNLVEAICIHAASGQPGIGMKRLARAANEGEHITVVLEVKGRKTGIELKRVFNKDMIGSDFQKLLALADVIKQLFFYMLESPNWTGRQVGALIFAHLLFCVDISFVDGKVDQLTLSPGFPSFRGSKEPMLQFYERDKSADPDLVFDTRPPDGFKGFVVLVNQICLFNEVACEPLRFVDDNGAVLDVVVGQELVYSGRNSVVLSCKNRDEQWPSSVLKVAPAEDSRREEFFHDELDKVPGVRSKVTSGYVTGAGSELRFVQLTGFGAELGRSNFDEGRLLALAEQACETIQGIHELKVLHRDIKPNNFIVVGDRLLLNDFDISCEQDDVLRRCIVAGTPMFKSPRLIDGEEYEQVDDWMSLGLTFMYLNGAHRSEVTKMGSLKKLLAAPWAPEVLKSNVAAGLELTEAKLLKPREAEADAKKRRKIRRKMDIDEDDTDEDVEDEDDEEYVEDDTDED